MRRRFDRFVLDVEEGVLLDGDVPVELSLKPFALLDYLVERAGRLVTKEDLLDRVWPGVHVTEGVLKTYMHEIRKALDDDAGNPRFIETVHGRGYRFLAPVADTAPAAAAARPAPPKEGRAIVGRENDLARLDTALAAALGGTRRIVFVTGEQGIGKTRLVEEFLERAARGAAFEAAGGQCVETYGRSEPYRPVLEAIARLCHDEPPGPRAVALLRRYAPTWLAQLPWLLDAEDRRSLEEEIRGRTQDRMMREIAEFLEAFTDEVPLVLVLEDLHWSDVATVELVTALAERREPARLLLLGTYRPTDVIVTKHVLRSATRELRSRGRCDEVALDLLSEHEVGEYVATTAIGGPEPALVRFLHRQTDGNPLFLIAVLDELVRRGLVTAGGAVPPGVSVDELALAVPGSLREMIEKQIDAVDPDDQRLLGAASLVGVEFSTEAVAAAAEKSALEVEEALARIARGRGVVEAAGSARWPDGTVTGQGRFVHALYRNVMHERVGAAARARAHARIGERLEAGHGKRAREIAAELADHFEQAGDAPRAVTYLDLAARNATRRHASREAIGLLTRALERLRALPEDGDRHTRELGLEVRLGQALLTVEGYAAPEVERTYARIRELRRKIGETTPLAFAALVGIWGFHVVLGDLDEAWRLANELWRLAADAKASPQLLGAHYALGFTGFFRGDFTAARSHLRQVSALYDPALRQFYSTDTTQDPKASSLVHGAWAAWFLGDEEDARRECREAIAFARGLGHPFSLLFTLGFAAGIEQSRGDVAAVRALTEEQEALSTEYGFPLWLPMGRILQGWVRCREGAVDEGITRIRDGLAAYRSAGAGLAVTWYLALLADCEAAAGHADLALAAVEEGLALAAKSGERFHEPELRRLRRMLRAAKPKKRRH